MSARVLTVTVADASGDRRRFYRAGLSLWQAERYNNGALVSIGLECPGDVSPATLRRWVRAGTAVEVTRAEWQHSGCQSSCVLRGQERCSW